MASVQWDDNVALSRSVMSVGTRVKGAKSWKIIANCQMELVAVCLMVLAIHHGRVWAATTACCLLTSLLLTFNPDVRVNGNQSMIRVQAWYPIAQAKVLVGRISDATVEGVCQNPTILSQLRAYLLTRARETIMITSIIQLQVNHHQDCVVFPRNSVNWKATAT